MNDMNQVFVIGRLTIDPKKVDTQNGTTKCTFSLANNRSYTSQGERKESANFFNCTAWGKLADTILQYLKKGSKVVLVGRLQQHSWDAQDGSKRSTVEIVIEEYTNLDYKKDQQQDVQQNFNAVSDENPFG